MTKVSAFRNTATVDVATVREDTDVSCVEDGLSDTWTQAPAALGAELRSGVRSHWSSENEFGSTTPNVMVEIRCQS